MGCKAIGVFMIVLGVICTKGGAAEKILAIPTDVQIITEGLRARLVEKDSLFTDSWWPADLPRVSPEAIPAKVYVHATKWLRTMIKPQWLPDDPNIWMAGVRKKVPLKADYLVLRYQIGGTKIQIQEDGAGVSLLIDTGAFADMEPDAFLTSVIRKFLRYPEDKLNTLKFFLKSVEHDGRRIYYGSVDCDFDRYNREAHFKRIWYNYTFLWTDRRRVFFSLAEMDGQPPKRKRARPGLPKRFKTSE
jgi:hypothetical protein